MGQYLDKLFSPSSIAVIGASERPSSVGAKVSKNLCQQNSTKVEAETFIEACRAAKSLGFPVVMKTNSIDWSGPFK